MPFYNSGQNLGGSGLGEFLKGGEEGFTFSQGVRSMLQKRKLDAQKASDEHTQAGITAATDLKSAGLEAAPQPGPTTGGGTVSPLDDPSNQPRSDGAVEVGGTTPISTGISNPQQSPSMLGRIGAKLGSLIHGNGGQSHTDSGNNVGTHLAPTPTYVDRAGEAGKQLPERTADIAETGAMDREKVSQAGLKERQYEGFDFTGQQNELDRANQLKLEQMRGNDAVRARIAAHQDVKTQQQAAILQKYLGNLNNNLHGYLGGLAASGDERARTLKEMDRVRGEMEQLLGFQTGELHAYTGDDLTPPQGQGGQLAAPGTEYNYGNGLPGSGDAAWDRVLQRHGRKPQQ